MKTTALVVILILACALSVCAKQDGALIASPGEAKQTAGWSGLVGGYVTAVFQNPDVIVIERGDLSSAIIVGPLDVAGFKTGQAVTVSGTVREDETFEPEGVTITGGSCVLDPISMDNRQLGCPIGNPGLASRDLLVTTTGKALDTPSTYSDGSTRFHIMDGTGLLSGPAAIVGESEDTAPVELDGSAIQVVIPASVNAVEVDFGDNVSVTGIVGSGMTVEGRLCSITIRQPGDLTVFGGALMQSVKPGKEHGKGNGKVDGVFRIMSAPPTQFFPVIVIAADNTGDFGPGTPGTATAGWQEAINWCFMWRWFGTYPNDYRAACHPFDIYVKGGRDDGAEAVFNIADTITITPNQEVSIDGGSYTLNWTGGNGKDMIFVDSQMDDRLTFDKIVYNGNQAAIRFSPTNLVPRDQLVCTGDCVFTVNSITGPGNYGLGVSIDTYYGQIGHARFDLGEVRNFGCCIIVWPSGYGFLDNHIRVNRLHNNASDTWLMYVGDSMYDNLVEIRNMDVDSPAVRVMGLDIVGCRNDFNVACGSNFDVGKAVTFESGSHKNRVNLIPPPGVSIMSQATDAGSERTNELTGAGPPLTMWTVNATTGTWNYYQNFFPVIARVVGGTISNVTLVRGADSVNYGTSRESVYLSPGDLLQVTSSDAPVIHFVPVKLN